MTVRELIRELEKLDQSRTIEIRCYGSTTTYDKIWIDGIQSTVNEYNIHIYEIY